MCLLSTTTVLATCTATLLSQAPAARFDVVITNGRLVDGTGAPWFRGDVGLVGDRIAAVGSLANAAAGARIDAECFARAWRPTSPSSTPRRSAMSRHSRIRSTMKWEVGSGKWEVGSEK